MIFSRSKELQEDIDTVHVLLNANDPARLAVMVDELTTPVGIHSAAVTVPEHLLQDLQMDEYLSQFPKTRGGKTHLVKLFHHPISDPEILTRRAYGTLDHEHWTLVDGLLGQLREDEANVLWLCSLPPMKDAWPISHLFPSWPILRWINGIPWGLAIFHIYRAYISPWLSIAYPASTIIGPWVYLRRQMKWKLSFVAYLKMLQMALKMILRPSGNYYQDTTKYLTLIMYVLLFVYGIVQSFDVAGMLRKILRDVHEKMASIQRFVVNANKLRSLLVNTSWPSAWFVDDVMPENPMMESVEKHMSSFYTIWKNAEDMKKIRTTLQTVYTMDAWIGIQRMRQQRGWCVPRFTDGMVVKVWGMGHPCLRGGGRRNPVDLKKNLMITGPNAAGKTTYVKAVCLNVLLGQSLGIVCGIKAVISPIHVFGSFLRIHDEVGTSSLFQAEVQRCASMIHMCEDAHKLGQRALFFLDEPMHSTPPIEGAATSQAILEKLASYANVRILCTTHYHELTKIEEQNNSFMNVSMSCVAIRNGFHFPYIIRKGPSYDCIALELLNTKDIPKHVVARAIEIKKILCERVLV